MDREDTLLGGCADGQRLLSDVNNEGRTPNHPQGDSGARIPSIDRSAEGNNDHEEDEDSSVQDAAHPIHFPDLLREAQIPPWVVRWEDEEINRQEEPRKRKIDVKCLW